MGFPAFGACARRISVKLLEKQSCLRLMIHVGQEMLTPSGTPDLTPTGVHIHFLPWVRSANFVCLCGLDLLLLLYTTGIS